MFHVHPIFRFFALQPPAFLTHYIRKTAKKNTQTIVTPLFLGALTVLIPCGVTQAIMALAIGTGNPLQAAAIMAAFTLGTSPVFFTLAYLATSVGKRLESYFLKAVAMVLLLLGLVAIDNGLSLSGSPVSFASLQQRVKSALQAKNQQADPNISPANPDNQITITVKDQGYVPEVSRARAGRPVKLILVTNDTYGCALAFALPSLGIERVLPQTGTTVIDLPPQKAGTLPFACSMGMYRGSIQFE